MNMKKKICIYIYIYMHICITESLCCTEEINSIVNQLHFNKINVLKALKKKKNHGG